MTSLCHNELKMGPGQQSCHDLFKILLQSLCFNMDKSNTKFPMDFNNEWKNINEMYFFSRVQFADDPNLKFQDEIEAYTSYKATGHFTPCPGEQKNIVPLICLTSNQIDSIHWSSGRCGCNCEFFKFQTNVLVECYMMVQFLCFVCDKPGVSI